MKRIAVVYRSKSGYTEKYAKWIADAVNGDLLKSESVKANDLLVYDVIVYGGGLYAVGINGKKLFTDNEELFKGKKLILFGVSASPCRPEIYEEVKNKNLTEEQQKVIEFHLLRGGFDKRKLNPVDWMLMQIMKLHLKRKKELTLDERGLLNAYETPVDFTKEKNVEPIIQSILKS